MQEEKANRVSPHFIMVSDCRTHCVQVFSSNGALKTGMGVFEDRNGQLELNTPLGIAVDRGRIFVADAQNRRVQVFNRVGDHLRMYGGDSAASSLNLPAGLAVDASGKLLAVSDHRNHRVSLVSCLPGEPMVYQRTIGSGSGHPSDKLGEFNEPDMMCFTKHGTLWVSDRNNHRVQEFEVNTGKVLRALGQDQAGFAPRGVAVNSHNELLVCDTTHDRICVFDVADGKLVRVIGQGGSGSCEFKTPIGIAVDVEDHIYVVDAGNTRVQVLKHDGSFVRSFGSLGSDPGQFTGPVGIALDDSPVP